MNEVNKNKPSARESFNVFRSHPCNKDITGLSCKSEAQKSQHDEAEMIIEEAKDDSQG